MSEIKNNPKNFVKIQEAAEILGVSTVTLRRWDKKKKLRPFKHPITGYRLYLKKDLKVFLDKFKK